MRSNVFSSCQLCYTRLVAPCAPIKSVAFRRVNTGPQWDRGLGFGAYGSLPLVQGGAGPGFSSRIGRASSVLPHVFRRSTRYNSKVCRIVGCPEDAVCSARARVGNCAVFSSSKVDGYTSDSEKRGLDIADEYSSDSSSSGSDDDLEKEKIPRNKRRNLLPDEGEDDDFKDHSEDKVSDLAGEVELDDEDFNLIEDQTLDNELEKDIVDAFEEFDDDEFEDEDWADEEIATAGDGGDGGGVVYGDIPWGKQAFILAETVVKELGPNFATYAFKAFPGGNIQIRLDKLDDMYGSPTMSEIETFTEKYRAILDTSEIASVNVALEVSSPGAERVVKIPQDLERFKQLPMYVEYIEEGLDRDGVLELESIDFESRTTSWKIANVKFNREQKERVGL